MKTNIIFSALFFICCSLNVFAQANNWLWVKGAVSGSGPSSYCEGYGLCSDANDNAFVTGTFHGPTITFGSTVLSNAGNRDLFIAKYDAAGNVLWAKSAGDWADDLSYSVCTDGSGNVFMTGYFCSPTITFGTITLTNTDPTGNTGDVFIVKYDPNGNVVWAQNPGGTSLDMSYAISSDAGGNVIITGYFSSPSLSLGASTLTNTATGNLFIVKYDTNGNIIWARNAGGTSNNWGYSVCTNSIGDIFVTGVYLGGGATIIFGSTTLTNAGSDDIFIAKYDANGNAVWAKGIGGTNYEDGKGVCADAAGNVFLTGYFISASISFGASTLTNAGGRDAFIAKYDANGNALWAKSAGGAGVEVGYSISADAGGNIFTTGSFTSASVVFDFITLIPPSGAVDPMYIVKYDPYGNVICASALSSGGDDQNTVTADSFGNAYVSGDFMANPFVVGTDTLPLTGFEDVFIAKYKANCGLEAISELSNDASISVFPNPSNGTFTLNSEITGGEIFIYDIFGKIVFQSKINSSVTTIDLSYQAKDIYLMVVDTDKKSFRQKIIIQ